ncbi:hypothetical protein FRC07_013205 [Ceratobasidium sp. 392]|nr:hypothetical protein FRC07_013205 [Ceratobasidium sp. 392]
MSNNRLHPDTSDPPYYVATYKTRSVAIKRDSDYQSTIRLVQKSIPKLRSADAKDIFLFTMLEDYGGALVQISEEIWPDVISRVKTIDRLGAWHGLLWITAAITQEGGVPFPPPSDPKVLNSQCPGTRTQSALGRNTDNSIPRSTGASGLFSIAVRTPSQKLVELEGLHSSSQIGQIKSLLDTKLGIPTALQRLNLFGERLQDTKTLGQSGVTERTILDLVLNARQSIIYVLPDPKVQPRGQRYVHENIKIQYSSDLAWELSALFPSRGKPASSSKQSISWNVSVSTDRTFFDHETHTESITIFWDGISQLVHSPTSTTSELHQPIIEASLGENLPIRAPLLDPSNSAAVPTHSLNNYISQSLSSIGFSLRGAHSRQFMSQIHRQNHEYLAIRFILQDKPQTMSSISTVPTTPKVARVLMLYKGLNDSTAAIWDMSLPRYDQGYQVWKTILGAPPTAGWSNQAGFEVYELAWMEVS